MYDCMYVCDWSGSAELYVRMCGVLVLERVMLGAM